MRESLIEETYEIVDAIDTGSNTDLKEELGDLFFLSLFVSYIAEQEGRLKVEDVIGDVGDKLVRRHPHVFGDVNEKNAEKIIGIWEDVKKNEEKNKERKRIFDGIPASLPEIQKFYKIMTKMKRNDIILDKVCDKELVESLKKDSKDIFIEKLMVYAFQNDINIAEIIRKINTNYTEKYNNET